MPSTTTPEQTNSNRTSAVHQPFSWLGDDVKDHPIADFVALTMDVCSGVQTCMEIVHLSDLVRSENADLDHEDAELPAVNANDAGKLMRLAIGTTRLLREYAARQIDSINVHGLERLQVMKGRAK
jgi:hypothetical protein